MLQMMQFGKYSLRKFGLMLKQLQDETSTIVLELIYKIMHKAQSNWLPLEVAAEVNQQMADFFLNIAYQADD